MKKLLRRVLALALCLTLFGGAAMAETLSLPEDSSTFSPELAAQTLSLFGTDAQTVRQAMANYGLTIVQVSEYWQMIARGAILIFAVAIDAITVLRAEKAKRSIKHS